MQRRSLLAAVPALFVAGCTGGFGDSEGTNYGDMDFSVVAAACGTEREEADVSFDEDAGTVSVAGTTSSPNACYSAQLADANYDAATDEFEVVVEAYREEDAGGCAECITEIEYEMTATFSEDVPGLVVVVHESRGETREVASASP